MKKYQKYNEAAKIVGSKAWSNNRYHNLKHNALGYIPDNCVMACRKCNLLKGKLLKSDTDRMMTILWKLS